MYDFKASDVNVYKIVLFSEGDDSESMEANIDVYKDGKKENFEIYVRLKNGKGYFRWNKDNQIKEFFSLRNSAFEVIKNCIKTIDEAKGKHENIKFLDSTAKSILNSLIQ